MSKNQLPLSIKFDPERLKRLILVAIGCILIGSTTYIFPDFWGHRAQIEFTVFMAIAGITLIFFLRQLYFSPVAITIDEFGINDSSSMASFGFLTWQEIESVFVQKIGSGQMIMVKLRENKNAVYRERAWWKIPFLKFNISMYGAPYAISASVLEISEQELLSIIGQQLNKTRSKIAY